MIKQLLKSIYYRLGRKLHGAYDRALDKKICGIDLTKYHDSYYRKSHGATSSQPTPYRILDKIFGDVTLSKSDSFIDIGCGKGRVIAYLLHNGFTGKITGIELDKDTALFAKQWAQKYDNVNIICDNVFGLDLTPYNVFFLFRPFEKPTFLEFLNKFENEIEKPVKLIFESDQMSVHFLMNRPGWKMQKRESIKKLKTFSFLPLPFPITPVTQWYSIWEYNPEERENYDGVLYEELCECRDYTKYKYYEKLNLDYCKEYDVMFDSTVTGKCILYSYKKGFDRKKCYKQNGENNI